MIRQWFQMSSYSNLFQLLFYRNASQFLCQRPKGGEKTKMIIINELYTLL